MLQNLDGNMNLIKLNNLSEILTILMSQPDFNKTIQNLFL